MQSVENSTISYLFVAQIWVRQMLGMHFNDTWFSSKEVGVEEIYSSSESSGDELWHSLLAI